MRISKWYDLNVHQEKQLIDMDTMNLLIVKTTEYGDPVTLQQQVGTGLQRVPGDLLQAEYTR